MVTHTSGREPSLPRRWRVVLAATGLSGLTIILLLFTGSYLATYIFVVFAGFLVGLWLLGKTRFRL